MWAFFVGADGAAGLSAGCDVWTRAGSAGACCRKPIDLFVGTGSELPVVDHNGDLIGVVLLASRTRACRHLLWTDDNAHHEFQALRRSCTRKKAC
jgi:hypothetical protein